MQWIVAAMIAVACVCFFAWILGRALADRQNYMSDEDYEKQLIAYREKQQWP